MTYKFTNFDSIIYIHSFLSILDFIINKAETYSIPRISKCMVKSRREKEHNPKKIAYNCTYIYGINSNE